MSRIFLIGIATLVLMSACSPQDERQMSVGLSDDEGDSKLAEAVFCTATSDELRNYTNPFNDDMKTWQPTFEEIYQRAQQQADALRSRDGAAIERRLNTISAQTKTTLANLDKTGNKEGFNRFIEQAIQQCASFAS